jgi:DNA-binding NtrC family response regulator
MILKYVCLGKQKLLKNMKKLQLNPNKFHKVLIVFDDEKHQEVVMTLLKRSMAFTPTCVKNLKEARIMLQEEEYDIVIFGDFIIGFKDGGYGYLLLQDIAQHQIEPTISIMVYTDKNLQQKAIDAGVNVVLSFYDIMNKKKLDENFHLVPIVSLVDK